LRDTWSRAGAFAVAVAALAILQFTPAPGAGAGAGAAIVPPQNPASNYEPAAFYPGPCSAGISASCPPGLSTIEALRASEGLAPMSLPTDFSSLSPQEQIFVVANLERVDRGVAPMEGVASALDADAQAGVDGVRDPSPPPYGSSFGSNWASGNSVFWADQSWVYQDGWGGSGTSNGSCTSPSAAGCWAHRDNILRSYASPALMGSGYASGGTDGGGVAQLFVGGDTHDSPFFSWSQVTPYLPVGIPSTPVTSDVNPGSSVVTPVELWASGESMNVGVSISGGGGQYSVDSGGCDLSAGQACVIGITFHAQSIGAYSGTLAVSGPNGVQEVSLHGVASPGYRTVAGDGGIFDFGGASYLGGTGGIRLNRPIVGMANDPATGGYWLVASDGGVFSYDAPYHGSTGGIVLNRPIVGIAATPDGGGYWLVASDGGVFSFGDAHYYGSMGGKPLNRPIVGMAANPGGGYWLVASDGGVFSFGPAPYYGSMGGKPLNRPIVGMAARPGGGGYWMVASDGGVFSFGSAAYQGSTGNLVLNAPVVGMATTPDGGGYWMVASDGGVFTFGDAGFFGSMGGVRLNAPMVGLASGPL
jgi:hypothetical protein